MEATFTRCLVTVSIVNAALHNYDDKEEAKAW
jgi:hypothetical protein